MDYFLYARHQEWYLITTVTGGHPRSFPFSSRIADGHQVMPFFISEILLESLLYFPCPSSGLIISWPPKLVSLLSLMCPLNHSLHSD